MRAMTLNEILTVANQTPWWAALAVSFGLGGLLGIFAYKAFRASLRNSALAEAEEIVSESKSQLEMLQIEQKELLQEIELEIWAKEEKNLLALEEKIEELEETYQELKQKADNKYSQERQKLLQQETAVTENEKKLKAFDDQLNIARQKISELNESFIKKLCEKTQMSREQASEVIAEELIRDGERRSLQLAQMIEEDIKEHSEVRAKSILSRALNRFHRAYCAERGIPTVYLEAPEKRLILVDPAGENLKLISELTGCDVICDEGMTMVGVAGFDPVRRELTRRVLERCLKERNLVSKDFIKKAFENIKRELLATIKRDGDLLAKELRLDHLHPEIRQVMGSLRYRYSFTQNQYFHCAEVGWLCGLLAAELRGVDVRKAKRAGMLHDLGKAMDHELEGGHAVIGADFIAARKEAADVVHAVKAHHYDETPSTDLAFLVIAADAISGARPGARRSTVESYNQKVTDLENIARSFDGVTDCYILNGGREVRVLVNGKRVDDRKALQYSKEIATRIENEMSYPGQIKVVVVRETIVSESTRAMHA